MLRLLDASKPASPTISQTLVTQLTDKDGSTVVALGGGRFAVGGVKRGDQAVLVLVDASNPTSLRYIPYDVGAPILSMQRVGNLLYTTSSLGLTIYQLDMIEARASRPGCRSPRGRRVARARLVQPATDRDSPRCRHRHLRLGSAADDTITWSQQVANVAAGATRAVVTGGELDYTVPTLGAGTLSSPRRTSRAPGSSASIPRPALVQVGTPATYTVREEPDRRADHSSSPSPASRRWVILAPSVVVPAGATVQVPLALTRPRRPDLPARRLRRRGLGRRAHDQVRRPQVWNPPTSAPTTARALRGA